jgi:hypothetical protein
MEKANLLPCYAHTWKLSILQLSDIFVVQV